MKYYLYLDHAFYQGYTILSQLRKYVNGKQDIIINKRYFTLEDFEKTDTLTVALLKKVSKARVGTVIDAGSRGLNHSYAVKVIDENDPYYQWCQLKEKNESSFNELHQKIDKFLADNSLTDVKKILEKNQRNLSKEYDNTFRLMRKV